MLAYNLPKHLHQTKMEPGKPSRGRNSWHHHYRKGLSPVSASLIISACSRMSRRPSHRVLGRISYRSSLYCQAEEGEEENITETVKKLPLAEHNGVSREQCMLPRLFCCSYCRKHSTTFSSPGACFVHTLRAFIADDFAKLSLNQNAYKVQMTWSPHITAMPR